MDTVLELRDLSKSYSSAVVDTVNLQIKRGSFFSLLGPSGCGKTTTLRMIAGFEQPSSGDILLSGQSIAALPPYQRNVSTVFQNYALFPHLTVIGNIAFGLKRTSATDASDRIRNVIDLVRLNGLESRYPAQLSGGERQRTALARSLVLEPDVLLLDEPLSALDPLLRKQVRLDLKQLQRRTGTTFVFITHDQEEALSLSDTMAVMNAGRIQQVGSPEALYQRPENQFVAGFLGTINWIGGVGVRPEATRISRDTPPLESRHISGVIETSTFLGHCSHVAARLQDGSAAVAEVNQSEHGFSPGDPVNVWWKAADEVHVNQ